MKKKILLVRNQWSRKVKEVMVDDGGYKIFLDKEKVDEHRKRILGRYRIDSDRSRDLERW